MTPLWLLTLYFVMSVAGIFAIGFAVGWQVADYVRDKQCRDYWDKGF